MTANTLMDISIFVLIITGEIVIIVLLYRMGKIAKKIIDKLTEVYEKIPDTKTIDEHIKDKTSRDILDDLKNKLDDKLNENFREFERYFGNLVKIILTQPEFKKSIEDNISTEVQSNKTSRISEPLFAKYTDGYFEITEDDDALYELVITDETKAKFKVRDAKLNYGVSDNLANLNYTCEISGPLSKKDEIKMKFNGEGEARKNEENKWEIVKAAQIEVN